MTGSSRSLGKKLPSYLLHKPSGQARVREMTAFLVRYKFHPSGFRNEFFDKRESAEERLRQLTIARWEVWIVEIEYSEVEAAKAAVPTLFDLMDSEAS